MDKNELRKYGIPKSVLVGGVTYKISFPYMFDEDSRLIGQHDLPAFCIKLGIRSPSHQSNTLPVRKVHECFLHELIHAVDAVYCGKIFTESDVDILALSWHCILQDNNLGIYKRSEKIPSKLKVLNAVYEIKYKHFNDLNDEDVFMYSCNTGTMWMDSRFRDTERYKSDYLWFGFMEIITSIIVTTFGLERFTNLTDVSDKSSKTEEKYPEKSMVSLAHGMFQVFRDNDIEGMIRKYE